MPTTWWQYWLYGLMELSRPHWFGWWSVALGIVVGLRVWWTRFANHNTPISQEKVLVSEPSKDRSSRFESAMTLRKLAVVLLQRAWEYDATTPLGVTLLGLQTRPQRTPHRDFLMNMERSLYDPLYDTKVSLQEMKRYMIDHSFFDWLTQWWLAN